MPVEYFIAVSIVLFVLLALVIAKWGLKGKKTDDSRVHVDLDPSEIELVSPPGEGDEHGAGPGEGDAEGDSVLPASLICPPGCEMKGAPPPDGDQVWFEDASGVRQGPFVRWEEGGNRYEGSYLNGENFGPFVRYFRDNSVFESGTYENGVLSGEWKKMYFGGGTMVTANYVDGKLHGDYVEYYPDGKIIRRVGYCNGEFDGATEMYTESGVLVHRSLYDHGVRDGVSHTYYEDGTMRGRDEYVKGVHFGRFEKYYPNGVLSLVNVFKDGVLSGDQFLYYDDGSLMLTSFVEDGIPVGKCEILRRDGSVHVECECDRVAMVAHFVRHDVTGDSSFSVPVSEVFKHFVEYFEENGPSS